LVRFAQKQSTHLARAEVIKRLIFPSCCRLR
jgi:hypothetical protein